MRQDTRRLGFVVAQFSALAWALGQSLRVLKVTEREGTATQIGAAREGVARAVAEIGKAATILSFSPISQDYPEVVGASALFNSLAEMLDAYWGDGDGQEPAPAFIIRAQEALKAFASAYGNGATATTGMSLHARQTDTDANIIADAKLVRDALARGAEAWPHADKGFRDAHEAFNRLSFMTFAAQSRAEAATPINPQAFTRHELATLKLALEYRLKGLVSGEAERDQGNALYAKVARFVNAPRAQHGPGDPDYDIATVQSTLAFAQDWHARAPVKEVEAIEAVVGENGPAFDHAISAFERLVAATPTANIFTAYISDDDIGLSVAERLRLMADRAAEDMEQGV